MSRSSGRLANSPVIREGPHGSASLSTDSLPFILVGYSNDSRRTSLRAMFLAVGSALLYAVCAVSMNFTNKAALMVFPYANTLLLIQMMTVLAVILPLRALKIVNFPALSVKRARTQMPVTVLYAGNVSCALLGLRLLDVPMYSTLKRLTPMMVLLTKWRMTHKAPSRGIFASMALVVLGCFIAGAGDLSFDLRGYSFALASCMLQAAYLLLVEYSGAKQGITTSELLAYNAALSLPFISAVVTLSGEGFDAVPAMAQAMTSGGTFNTLALLAVCSLSGVALNFSMFLCTSLNSALTTTIVGTLKGVVATTLGFFLLGGVEMHVNAVVGIALNAVGGVMYSVVKYRSRASCQKDSTPLLPSYNSGSTATLVSTAVSSDSSPVTTPRQVYEEHCSPKDSTDIDSAYCTPTSLCDSLTDSENNSRKQSSKQSAAPSPSLLQYSTGAGVNSPTSPWVSRKSLSMTIATHIAGAIVPHAIAFFSHRHEVSLWKWSKS